MQSIHCKVSLDDQYRRFLFKFSTPSTNPSGVSVQEESQFPKIQHQVRSLYGFGGDFVLKYKDDEGDLIIIECDEELNCAVAQSAGLLRLFIKLKDEPMADTTTTTSTTTPTATTTPILPSEHTCPYHYGRFGHHGRGGRRGGRGNGHWHDHGHGRGFGHGHGHGYGHGKHHGKRGSRGGMFNIEKLTSKRELIAAVLNDPQVHTDEYRKLKLQRKLECIDRRLAIANSTDASSSSSSGDEKWRKKKCDKYKKKYQGKCNRQRKTRRNLTEDEKVVLQVLKAQIWELKPTLNTVKIQLCEKQAMKNDAENKGDMQRVEELKKEIQQLKEIKKEHKNAIAPLKNQIFALKFEKQE